MSATELALVVGAVLCAIGFAALVVVLVRVLDALTVLRAEVATLRAEAQPLLVELRESTDAARTSVAEARRDLARFDRVLGSAESLSGAIGGVIGPRGPVAKVAYSTPAIKVAALGTGARRVARRLRR